MRHRKMAMDVMVKILKQNAIVGRFRNAVHNSGRGNCRTSERMRDKSTVTNSTSDMDKFTMKRSWMDLFTFRFTAAITNALPMAEMAKVIIFIVRLT